MEYLVTALCVMLSCGVSIMAFRFLDRYLSSQEQQADDQLADFEGKGDGEHPEAEKAPALRNVATNTPSSVIPEMNVKRWFQLILCGLLTGCVCFLRVYRGCDWILVAETAVCALSLSAVGIIDGRIKKIPNKLVLVILAVGAVLLVVKCIAAPENSVKLLLTALAGAVGCLLLFLLFTVLTKGGFGMGDTKLTAALGLVLGLMDTMVTVLLGMILCMLVSVTLLLLGKKTLKDDMPFGPYIFLGYILIVVLEYFL